jgi:hypothetical protein
VHTLAFILEVKFIFQFVLKLVPKETVKDQIIAEINGH